MQRPDPEDRLLPTYHVDEQAYSLAADLDSAFADHARPPLVGRMNEEGWFADRHWRDLPSNHVKNFLDFLNGAGFAWFYPGVYRRLVLGEVDEPTLRALTFGDISYVMTVEVLNRVAAPRRDPMLAILRHRRAYEPEFRMWVHAEIAWSGWETSLANDLVLDALQRCVDDPGLSQNAARVDRMLGQLAISRGLVRHT